MIKDNFGKIFFGFIVGIFVILWLSVSYKAALLTMSLFCLFMWLNTSLTTLGNAFIGRNIDVNYDIFWKILFIILASVGLGVYFNI